MAGKFKIFCDDCPRSTFVPDEKNIDPILAQMTTGSSTNTATTQTSATANVLQELTAVAASKFTIAVDPHSQPTKGLAGGTTSAATTGGGVHSNNSNNDNIIHDKKTLNGATGGQPLKREPLGLRQTSGQAISRELQSAHSSQQSSSSTHTSSLPNTSSSTANTTNDEDQENDISMASLGSDFVPSIMNDTEYDDQTSFDLDDELISDENQRLSNQHFNRHLKEQEQGLDHHLRGSHDDESYLFDEDDDDADIDDDEELQKELKNAFKQHDDSQLFKSTAYIDDIQTYLKELERKSDSRPLPNYMDFQDDINSDKRSILVNWLMEVAEEFEVQSETLFICINIIDRFLSKMSIPTSNFQLLGIAAMFVAAKYEEIYAPTLYQLVEVTDETYTGKQICQMEQVILKTLNFRISLPTISYFLRQIFAFNKFTKKVYHMAEYLCHLALLADQPFLEYLPSEIAIAAVILAAHQLDASASITAELKSAYDKSNSDQLSRRNLPKGVKHRDLDRKVFTVDEELPFCIEALREIQERAYSRKPSETSQFHLPVNPAVVLRYSMDSHDSVSLLQPPTIEDLMSY